MAITLIDIDKNLPGGCNPGGIVQRVFYGFWKDVETWPTKPDLAVVTTLEALAVLTGDIVMKTGKRLWEIYITDDTGEFKCELVGEKDGKSFIEHLSLFHPGLQKTIVGFMNAAKNENLVFIVEDNTGQLYLMGDASRPATLEGSPDGMGTGKETAARRGVSMEFTYKTCNIYIYEGDIPLTPAVAPGG
jgi:hypothetical protein